MDGKRIEVAGRVIARATLANGWLLQCGKPAAEQEYGGLQFTPKSAVGGSAEGYEQALSYLERAARQMRRELLERAIELAATDIAEERGALADEVAKI